MSDVKVIEVNQGYEDRFLIEHNLTDTSKFFYPVYKRSAELIDEICSYGRNSKKDNIEFEEEYYPNNIIVFCAERGGGKSTAMLSVANALKALSSDEKNKNDKVKNSFGNMAQKCKFSVLSPIDPTSISSDENFMRIVLSRIFSDLRCFWKIREKDVDTLGSMDKMYARSEIVEKFTECYKLLDVIYKSKTVEMDNDLEELTELGDFSRLKNKFMKLVDCYLRQIYGTSDNCYLVLLVDDADLNAQKSFEIIEDIRKYCILPNVIVLMAANMDQMHQIIEQHFILEFKTLLDYSDKNKGSEAIDARSTKEMTVKYLNKVIPTTHQIHLPVISDFIVHYNSSLGVQYKQSKVLKNCENCESFKSFPNDYKDKIANTNNDMLTYFPNDYQERLLNLIHKKTGVGFVKPENYLHNFLPGNMRDLTHFLSYFCALPDLDSECGYADLFSAVLKYSDGDKEYQHAQNEIFLRLNNLDALQVYFLSNWCYRNLTRKNHKIISELADTIDTLKITSALNTVNEIIAEREIELNNAGDTEAVMPVNTYAELMHRISLISNDARNHKDFMQTYKLVFALRLLFTILLHREILKGLRDNDFRRVRKVTGGMIWHFDYKKISPNFPYGHFVVNYQILEKLLLNVSNININPVSLKNGFNDGELITSCYLIQDGETKKMEPSLVNKLRFNSDDVTIVFDASVYLLDFFTSKYYYILKDEDSLIKLNYLYEVLVNWEVFHDFSRSAEEKLINDDSDFDPVTWHMSFLNLICGKMKFGSSIEYPYLNISETDGFLYDTIHNRFIMDRSIFFTNRNNINAIIKGTIQKMKIISQKILASERSVVFAAIANFTTKTLPELDRCLELYIRPLDNFVARKSPVHLLENKFANLMRTLNQFRDKIINKSDSIKVEKGANLSMETMEEYVNVINDWVNTISAPDLVDQIMKSVDKAFGIEENSVESRSQGKKSNASVSDSNDN